jgi:uncharacterized Zn finger protein
MSNTKLTWPDVEARLARAREVVTAGGVKVTAAETPNAFIIANGGNAAYTVQFGQATPHGLGTCTCDDWQQRGGPCKHLLAAVLTQWPARLETYLAKARSVVPPAAAAPAVPEAVVRAAVQSALSHVLTAVMAAVEEQSAAIAEAVLADLTKEASTN